jgi:hypothetical protein
MEDSGIRKCFSCKSNFFTTRNFKNVCFINSENKIISTIHHESIEKRNEDLQKPYKIIELSDTLKIKKEIFPTNISMCQVITRDMTYKKIKIGEVEVLEIKKIQEDLFKKRNEEVVAFVNSKIDIFSSNFRPDRISIIQSCFFIEFVIISLKSDVSISLLN